MSNHASPIAQINVTPLVDVMLVLLIIFMITAPTLTQRLLLSLPQRQIDAKAAPAPLRLVLAADGRMNLDGKTVDAALLAVEAAHLAALTEGPGIEIAPERSVRYERVVAVLATLKDAGLSRVAFGAVD